MYPNPYEIEAVGNAFISIGHLDYNSEQFAYLQQYLRNYAQEFDESEVKMLFSDKSEIIDAIKTLHHFALQYQSEQAIYNEFREEVEELIITLNDKEDFFSI